MSFNWTCPYCNRPQVVTNNICNKVEIHGHIKSKHGPVCIENITICCANEDCKNIYVSSKLTKALSVSNGLRTTNHVICEIGNLPSTTCKIQPEYVPKVLVEDYYEACAIVKISPKASATLARRCLQGMIRDFCSISKTSLIKEIAELRSQVTAGTAPRGVEADVVDALDAMRTIGNIGAHMEKDINIIVDADPNEAATLLQMLELLFDEWYVARHVRQARIAAIQPIADTKASQKALPPPPP